MISQTAKNKRVEIFLRRKLFEQRFKKIIFNPRYKTGDINHYLTRWIRPQIKEFAAFISSMCKEKIEGGAVLEIGSESGHMSAFLSNTLKPRLVIASDIAETLPEALSLVAECLGFRKLPKVVTLDNYNMPFKDEAFDFVFGLNVLHHFPDPQAVLGEVRRVLKKDGLAVFIGEPFLPPYLLFLQFFFSRFDKKLGVSENVFTLKQWFSSMRDFKVLKIMFKYPQIISAILPHTQFLNRYFTGGGMGVILQKNKS